MTANELADELERMIPALPLKALIKSATMLRQQQAEIKALHNLVKEQDKKIIDLAFDLEYAKRTDEFVKKENEDRDSAIYATGYWKGIEYKKMRNLTEDTECQYCKQGCFRCDARKALTDEEIYDCFKIPKDKRNTAQSDYNIFGCREVADAILKKASEK
jgi:hypothetical protein